MVGGTLYMYGIFVEITQHNRALKRGNEDRRYLVHIDARANLPALYAFVYNAINGGAPIIHGGSRTVSQHHVGVIRLNCRIENWAAADNRGGFDDPLKDGDESQETLDGVQLPS